MTPDLTTALMAEANRLKAQLAAIRAEALAELERVEREGGLAGFAERILAIVGKEGNAK